MSLGCEAARLTDDADDTCCWRGRIPVPLLVAIGLRKPLLLLAPRRVVAEVAGAAGVDEGALVGGLVPTLLNNITINQSVN